MLCYNSKKKDYHVFDICMRNSCFIRYKEGRYPENMESFKIFNSSPMEAEVSFCFFTDSKGETFLLDPPSGTLKPNDSMALTVWAYPKVFNVLLL